MEVGQRKSAIVLSQSAVGKLVWFGMNLPPHEGLVVVNELFDG
jgi:hypothetical protein